MICYDERIQGSIKYIENHLTHNLDMKEIAIVSGFSLSHFCKIFHASTGFTVKEYIRNKRLAVAARKLVKTNKKIIDIYSETGFNSQEVFIRAFKKLYKMTPVEYRKKINDFMDYDKRLAFSKLIGQHSKSGKKDLKVDIKIVKKEEIYLIGMPLITSVLDWLKDNTPQKFWINEFIPRIIEIKNIKNYFVSMALKVHNPDTDELNILACVEVKTPSEPPEGMVLKVLPESKYAVFTPEKPLVDIEECTSMVQFFFGEWLPVTGNQRLSNAILDVYYSDDYYPNVKSLGSKHEIYIPIK